MATLCFTGQANKRTETEIFLSGKHLGIKFHQLFDVRPGSTKATLDEINAKTKAKKKSSAKTPVKTKNKRRDRQTDRQLHVQPVPTVELTCNPSSFAVYCGVRRSVLASFLQRLSASLCRDVTPVDDDSDVDDGDASRSCSDAALHRLPKIVSIGLCSVFEVLRETQASHPALCHRTLVALLNILQGQSPEGLRSEPADIVDSLYQLLMELSSSSAMKTVSDCAPVEESYSLSAVACCCLMSLVVGRGDTGKLLTAVAAMLMYSTRLAAQHVMVPHCLVALQRSVYAVLIGRTQAPDWLTHGIPQLARTASAVVSLVDTRWPAAAETFGTSVASDGRFLYVHDPHYGLLKIGCGYGNTIMGRVYAVNTAFQLQQPGWLAVVKRRLLYASYTDINSMLVVVNIDTLQPVDRITFSAKGSALFSDGDYIGHVTPSRDTADVFVLRTYDVFSQSPSSIVHELPLKLARKCLDVFGRASCLDQTEGAATLLPVGAGVLEEDAASVHAGKDFALMRTHSGKILYTGKCQCLGIKSTPASPAAGAASVSSSKSSAVDWKELAIVKSPKIVQCSVGHDGQHGLLVADDGSVFFVGVARRGEDGDSSGSLSKSRRQVKAVKPKKMIRVEGKTIVMSACNCGTSMLVSREGEVFVFGKDTFHCDNTTGLLADMKGVPVTSVALGKAHAVMLTDSGHVYTFGPNNKGQCGRDFTSTNRELCPVVTMADDEAEFEDENMCPPGRHQWLHRECMICTVCDECTGYGSSCVTSANHADRVPGQRCGCGPGDAGCVECGACRYCAGENVESSRELANGVMLGAESRGGVRARIVEARRNARLVRQRLRNSFTQLRADVSDHEQDPIKLNSLPPGRVDLDSIAVQIACGLQHTVVLTDSGDVFAFGSNQFGQLGTGDTVMRGSPVKMLVKSLTQVRQVSAGSSHSVLLTTDGHVLTCGSNHRGQLGRVLDDTASRQSTSAWLPAPVNGIGRKHGRRATWVGASGDQTFVKIDESLINVHTLSNSSVVANQSCIGLIPTVDDADVLSHRCLMISRVDGSCRSFSSDDQASFVGSCVCLDPVYDNLWTYAAVTKEMTCYNIVSSGVGNQLPSGCDVLSGQLAVPARLGHSAARSHCAINMLGCLDTLTSAQSLGLSAVVDDTERSSTATAAYIKDDYSVVNRFESYGGGWGYSGHSIEAVRFSCDSDVLLGGFGLFGGRGEYFGKIRLYELGAECGENEGDGDVLAETEEQPYRCAPREKHGMLFDEPVLLQANMWYVAWARISGPSSDCGSSGQTVLTTDDQVTFRFRNSKKSNNGTDANAGQIPQLLYRLPVVTECTPVTSTIGRKMDQSDAVHVLSLDFSHSVSPECFESLLSLLSWSWGTFCCLATELSCSHDGGAEFTSSRGASSVGLRAAGLDLGQLVYISTASLRLIRTYVCSVYPPSGIRSKMSHGNSITETPRLAECVGEVRLLLRQILSESSRYCSSAARKESKAGSQTASNVSCEVLREKILDECHTTFTYCFHAFYPTNNLKWSCLCELLTSSDPLSGSEVSESSARLLSAVLTALSQLTSARLTDVLPVSHHVDTVLRPTTVKSRDRGSGGPAVSAAAAGAVSMVDDNHTASSVLGGESANFPMLVGHMLHQTEMELVGRAHSWTVRDVLDKLLVIAGNPIRHALGQEKVALSSVLVDNACRLLISLVSELCVSAAATSHGSAAMCSQPLLSTPNRFGRTSQGSYWNSGNGSPDAVCFSVDRPGIIIAGVGIYGGGGTYECDVEILDDMERSNDPSPNSRWNTIEMVKAFYGADDCVNDIAEVKFDRPVPIKENVKYAIRLRNRGQRTRNGDAGMTRVKCSDGSVFTFSSCSLSSNGTNQSRGQIPVIYYYSSNASGSQSSELSQSQTELQTHKNAVSVVSTIFRAATELLAQADAHSDVESVLTSVHSAAMFTTLIPMICACVGPVAIADLHGAVEMLSLVHDMLPPLTSLVTRRRCDSSQLMSGADKTASSDTCRRYYAVVESDHPYKPAAVHNYRVTFQSCVRWMSVEFDRRCGTAQTEDCLQLYIPAASVSDDEHTTRTATASHSHTAASATAANDTDNLSGREVSAWWPVLSKCHGVDRWPASAVILPGNEVCFSLETASDYVKDEKACFFGFRCTVIGYEWPSSAHLDLSYLEQEIAGLGGMCAAALMKKDITLPATDDDDDDDEAEDLCSDASLKREFVDHGGLLKKGISLQRAATVTEALAGRLPLCDTSSQRSFLTDFINCAPRTSGARLATWLQPESYVDPQQTVILHNADDVAALYCSVPVTLSILTRDQYGVAVAVPNLTVEAAAIPVVKEVMELEDKHGHHHRHHVGDRLRRLSGRRDVSENMLLFGGHAAPPLDVPYQVTVKDNRDSCHAISMMKAYENYSFEEVRFASPTLRRPTENMLVRDNGDGSYTASWTPAASGLYHIQVKLDAFDTGEVLRVEVKDNPHVTQPSAPPVQRPPSASTSASPHTRLRKFVAQHSAGLRVRLHPSLQSEQIGVIPPGGIVSFTSELHNDDGLWLRLTAESIREYCSPLNGFTEGWALQYNQHLAKTLLVPVTDRPAASDDHHRDRQPPPAPPPPRHQLAATRNGFPSSYTTVKCGTSGHNIRAATNLDSAAVGMVVIGNQIIATREVTTGEGVWIELDAASIQCYCHDQSGGAWCLVSSCDGDVFLRAQSEMTESHTLTQPSPFQTHSCLTAKGFDFTKASKTPTFSPFTISTLPEFSGVQAGSTGVFSRSPAPSELVTVQAGRSGVFGSTSVWSDITPSVSATDKLPNCLQQLGDSPGWSKSGLHSSKSSVADPLSKARSASLRREASPYMSPRRSLSPVSCDLRSDEHRGGLVQFDIPGLPPELQGVSVKELVKAIGESRVNGNGVTPPRTPPGVTPPRTPPGTPKKTAFRSSSPRTPVPGCATPDVRVASPAQGLGQGDVESRRVLLSVSENDVVKSCDAINSLSNTLSTDATSTLRPAPRIASRSTSASPRRVDYGTNVAAAVSSSCRRTASESPVRFPLMSTTHSEPFRLSPSSVKDSSSSKLLRRERSRRSKRDRAVSPAKCQMSNVIQTGRGSRDALTRLSRCSETVGHRSWDRSTQDRKAMSPSVALCLRAVYAAFLWDEGIVHDAMACASYLKFHPSLPKDLPKDLTGRWRPAVTTRCSASSNLNEAVIHKGDMSTGMTGRSDDMSAGMKGRSDDMSAGMTGRSDDMSAGMTGRSDDMSAGMTGRSDDKSAGMTGRSDDKSAGMTGRSDDKSAGMTGRSDDKSAGMTARSDDMSAGVTGRSETECRVSESQTVSSADSVSLATSTGNVSGTLPMTLSYLVLFWEELSRCTLKNISDSHVSARSTAHEPAETLSGNFRKKEGRSKVAAKKPKDGKLVSSAALRGNLFGAAADELVARVSSSADRECDVLCELCGEEFAHPVTYHMRQSHPGCGRPAGGQGYNSGGNFCGGWAGSCGDGGVGGSTWYLMCDTCRTKYMREKKKGGRKERLKKPVASDVLARKKAGPVSSAPTQRHWIVYQNAMFVLELAGSQMSVADCVAGGLSAVSEDANPHVTMTTTTTFSPVPFLYLQLHGASADDSVFANGNDVTYYRPHTSLSGGGLDRSVSDSSRHTRRHLASTYHCDVDDAVSVGGKGVFQRSISEMGAIGQAGTTRQAGAAGHGDVVGRGGVGVGDNGLSLVKCPSTDMARLIRSLKSVDNLADHVAHLPVVSFLAQQHDLDVLHRVLVQAARRAACRTYALDALNWLLRSVSETCCIHDLLWHLVTALSSSLPTDDDETATDDNMDVVDADQDVAVCCHPLCDVSAAGHVMTKPLVNRLHTLLQSVADVLMHVPADSAVQRMAVRCWSMQFLAADHTFLHRSHVFSHISRILSSVDEAGLKDVADVRDTWSGVVVEQLTDLTQQADIKTSSRQAMIAGLTDGSTETFWESGDDDKNKTKSLTVTCAGLGAQCRLRVVCLHVDNARDIGNKVSTVMIGAGLTSDSVVQVRNVELDQRHVGWVCAWVANSTVRFVRVELRGPDNTLRVRQLKLLGERELDVGHGQVRGAGDVIEQRQCQNEALSVFRLLTSLVFGRLVTEGGETSVVDAGEHESLADDVDLKEHMVGILFSHTSELTKLQRQVCAHIVGSIHAEARRVRSLWESVMTESRAVSDAYCFELLSLLLALSGSAVGRRYVAQQDGLIEDVVSLLHTASARVQRQVVLLLRRTLVDITPRSLASLLGIATLPPSDVSALVRSSDTSDGHRPGLLDVFLACIAKALSVQVKSRLPGVTSKSASVNLASSNVSVGADEFWWLRGSGAGQLAESIIKLLTDMAAGRLGAEWATVTKSSIAGPIVSLSRLPSQCRTADVCLQSPVIWLALAALCVLTQEHVDQLSTGRWSNVASTGSPTCDNHDDGETPATILCASGCGSLCTDCDRVLHLSKRNRLHQRQVLKEEEESIRVDLHEGCGRVKFYWLLALADAKTLKAVVEFRHVSDQHHILSSSSAAVAAETETCRFCGSSAASLDVLVPGAVCSQPECLEHSRNACSKTLSCGHLCGGIRSEERCLPCLYRCVTDEVRVTLRQDADDMCMICFTDALSAAPVILLDCGHAFHAHCCHMALERRWPGPRITFTFMRCPICKRDMAHTSLEALIAPVKALRDDVQRKALMRLEYEGVMRPADNECPSSDVAALAMDRYAYYVCHKCSKAYYGGEARCEVDAVGDSVERAAMEDYDPSELVCGACSDVARAQMCVRHGADFLEYKCRYCCSVAVFFCFGTTHFCGACHDDFQRVTAMSRADLPRCPAGPRATQLTGDECPLHVQHPDTGEEFALGCGVCRNAHTF